MTRRLLFALSLLAAGTLACDDPTEPTDGAMRFTEVAVGRDHSCAVDADGRVFCWGGMFFRPVQMAYDRPATELMADASCALTEGTILCWEMAAERLAPAPIDPDLGWSDYDGSDWNVRCGITADDDEAYCWGSNDHGQLGTGTDESADAPQRVVGDQTWRSIDVRGSTVCAIAMDRSGFCWGRNDMGQLGVGDTADRNLPTLVVGGHEWQDIQLGDTFACGLTTDEEVYCWGSNLQSQLGRFLEVAAFSPVPLTIDTQLPLESLSVGASHACAIERGGWLRCWGNDDYGKTGTGEGAAVATPTLIGDGRRFADVAAGADHTCAATLDGDVYCWGANDQFQLGDRTQEDRAEPVQVVFDPRFTEED